MEQLSVKINNLIKNYGSKEILNIEELSAYQTDRGSKRARQVYLAEVDCGSHRS